MSDLARQVAEELWVKPDEMDIESVVEAVNSVGTLVSHEDAAWLKLARCPDPLTLDAAVKVMGREPDEHDILQHEGHELWGWTPERIRVRRWLESETFDVLCGFTKYDNPTIGLFALLVAAAKMGEKA